MREELKLALEELEAAWNFVQQVKASPEAERLAVGQDHHEWHDRATARVVAAWQKEKGA